MWLLGVSAQDSRSSSEWDVQTPPLLNLFLLASWELLEEIMQETLEENFGSVFIKSQLNDWILALKDLLFLNKWKKFIFINFLAGNL